MSSLLQSKRYMILDAMLMAHQIDAICTPLECLRGVTEDEDGLLTTGAFINPPSRAASFQVRSAAPGPSVIQRKRAPDASVRAQVIVHEFIGHLLDQNSCWGPKPSGTLQHLLRSHLKKSWRDHEQASDDVVCRILQTLSAMRVDIEAFIGDDKWIMHFFSYRGHDIVIDQCIDFRIYDWTRRMESGEWK